MKNKIFSLIAVVLFSFSLMSTSKTLEDQDCHQYAMDAAGAEEEAFGFNTTIGWFVSYGYWLGTCESSDVELLNPVFLN